MAFGWTPPERQGQAGSTGRLMAPRFTGRGTRIAPVFDDDPRAIPADLVGSVGHMLDDDARQAFRSGPSSAEEELAYAQAVAPGAHAAARPAPASVQEAFRHRRSFDAHRFFLAPDGNLYARGDTPAENPGWTLRRQMRGLAGESDDPTLNDLMQRHFRFASDEGEGLAVGDQSSAPAGTPTGGTAAQPVPQLSIKSERVRSILDNTPAEFPVTPTPDAFGGAPDYAIAADGVEPVREHHEIIEEEAKRVGIDPDLLRAVMYVENAQGHYRGLADVAEFLGIASSLFPMNINPDLWGSLSPYGSDLYDPRNNIAAAAELLKRISDRVPDGDITKVATLYNTLSADEVRDYGARVAEVYRSRGWVPHYQRVLHQKGRI
jgi:hypothetical protein